MVGVGRPSTLGGTFPGYVSLVCVKKVAEQNRGSLPVSSISTWSLLQFLPCASALASFHDGLQYVSLINPLTLKLFFVMVFVIVAENQVRQEENLKSRVERETRRAY